MSEASIFLIHIVLVDVFYPERIAPFAFPVFARRKPKQSSVLDIGAGATGLQNTAGRSQPQNLFIFLTFRISVLYLKRNISERILRRSYAYRQGRFMRPWLFKQTIPNI